MLDELTTNVVQMRKLQVVTRANLDVIKKEMNFQLSGEVSDETMQQLGAKTGAQTVISGTFKQLGIAYILNIQAFNVTTAAIQDVYRVTVSDDDTLALLMKKKVLDASGNVTKSVYDYTGGQRIGIGFQNMLFGLGSYINGHWGDGLFMTTVEGLGIAMIAKDDSREQTQATAGLFMIVGSCLYGFCRPWFYHKKQILLLMVNMMV